MDEVIIISIHAPREGCDPQPRIFRHGPASFQSTHPVRGATFYWDAKSTEEIIFQSTHPVRGATDVTDAELLDALISIHAPREGCDLIREMVRRTSVSFQSTHPVRGATSSNLIAPNAQAFQSTHPVRGATLTQTQV